jgi:hypothetical protein
MAKTIASEVAQEFDINFKEVDMGTKEGLNEGLVCEILSTPSIVLNGEVIVRGRLVSKERLKEEVRRRIEKWRERSSKE